MSAGAAASTLDATSPARPGDGADASLPAETPSEPERVLEAGDRAGDFVIESVLGRGSFGTVYRAAHAVIGRRGAVKVLREHAAEARRVAAFIEEARLVARLRHPNIVDVLTFGQLDDGRHYQVMDLIEGPTLADYLRDHGALTLTQALPILRGVASALDAVHRNGVAHRDLKPPNVVLEQREAELVPKLIDFGVAELIAPGAESTGPRGGTVGTPRYMAPEQCRGDSVDARADVYAFGLLAYEMLTGKPPFSGESALELMLKHTSEEPVALSRSGASLPRAIDEIVLPLLEKSPEKRPTELAPVVRALEAVASQQEPGVLHLGGRASRRPLPLVGAGVVAVAIAGLLVYATNSPAPLLTNAAVLTPPPPPATEPATASPAEPTATVAVASLPSAQPSAQLQIKSATPTPSIKPTPSSRAPAEPGLEDSDNPFKKR